MFGVYVHFPYCRVHCPYCDFAVAVRAQIPHARYADAVLRELEQRAPRFAGRELVSIYFGGGTPSLWQAEEVARVIAGVRSRFTGSGSGSGSGSGYVPLEITVEANPDALPRTYLDALVAAGVNRLSVGVQSLAPAQLVTLGRSHGAREPAEAVAAARAAGVASLSLDLMYGLPSQTLGELERDLEGVLALAPDHLSVYSLTLEERTPFAVRAHAGLLPLPDEDTHADMAELVEERLARAGFLRHEISSWARPGKRAVHNRLYWSGGEWLGLGCSSHSYRRTVAGGERWSTVRGADEYLALEGEALVVTCETLDEATLGREAMWLGLRRLDEGVVRGEYRARFGEDPVVRFAVEIERLVREGLVGFDDERLILTRRGARFADEVGARFV